MPARFPRPARAARPAAASRPQRLQAAMQRRRERLDEAVAESAARLLPLLGALQPQPGQESVFRTRRKLLRAHWEAAYAELQAQYPGPRVLAHALRALAELLRDEAHDISPEEWQQAARELALATLKNAPALLSAARQARRLL